MHHITTVGPSVLRTLNLEFLCPLPLRTLLMLPELIIRTIFMSVQVIMQKQLLMRQQMMMQQQMQQGQGGHWR
tara:strand:+ start:4057 stop:4275 length:219 start_codon:yes stop_codon:yes gene_type:complete